MNYHPTEIEKKWVEKWTAQPFYKAEDFSKKKKYYALVEFPYPSGTGLSIGGAFTYIILDIFARKKRMEGYNILYPMGWDAFGLPTENYAIKTGIHPVVATKSNTNIFRQQMQQLAMSYDWLREIDTTDPNYYKWTQWIFMQLFKHGLAYKEETPVGWCPACKIILANEEIVSGKCERCGAEVEYRRQKQWLLRITAYADRLADELDMVDYPDYVKKSQRDWIGRKEWIDITYPIEGTKETIVVSTTRPDTNFGATFIVVAPEHSLIEKIMQGKIQPKDTSDGGKMKVENSTGTFDSSEVKERIKKYIEIAKSKSELERISEAGKKTGVFTGLYAVNQLNGYRMPIWITDFVLVSVGTGAVVGVPGHDLRDFEFAQQFGLEVIRVVVGSDGDKSPITKKEQVQEEEGVMVNSDFLDGMDIHAATKKIMDYFEKKGWGRRTIRYHLRDWVFSRQHYWGEPFPMVYCESCAKKGISWWDTKEGQKHLEGGRMDSFQVEELKRLAGWFPVSGADLPVKLPKVEKYQPTDTGESPLANIKDWVQTKCPNCGDSARRETDTMPNWAGSSWYYLAFCFAKRLENEKLKTKDKKQNKRDAENIFSDSQKELNYWMPVDLYLGGAEHTTLHLLYSRFWHKFLNDIGVAPGKEPYAARRQHGVILGEDGQRMSKSRGNVINPEGVMDKFGADTLRVYLMFMGPYDSTMPWSTKGVEGCYRFLSRIWRFYQQESKIGRKTSPELIRELHRLIKKVGDDIESLKHNTAIAAMMEFLNCWQGGNSELQFALSRKDAGIFLRLLAPFAPFLAEELWQQLKSKTPRMVVAKSTSSEVKEKEKTWSIHQQPWPKYDPKLIQEEKVTIVIQVNGKVRGQVEVRSEKCEVRSEVEELARKDPNVAKYLTGQKVKKTIFIPAKLINFVV